MTARSDGNSKNIKLLFDEHQEFLLGLEMRQQKIIDETKAEELRADLLDI
jgi:hypothetical protein